MKCEERTKRLSRLTASEALLIPIAIPERGVSGEENTSEIIVTLNRINRKEATLYDIRNALVVYLNLILRFLRTCLRDLILPLQVPFVRLGLPELCCQFGVAIRKNPYH